jgi:hypothetical protein
MGDGAGADERGGGCVRDEVGAGCDWVDEAAGWKDRAGVDG